MRKKVELLAPAGSLEKLKVAILYGADAVYLGDSRYSLRAGSKNFSREDMLAGLEFAHARGKKVYVTVNIFPRSGDLEGLPEYLDFLAEAGADGILVADLGVFMLAKARQPDLPLHISTQANTVNRLTAKAWEDLGARRIVLARELSLDEIKDIRKNISAELEIFVHGAMCVSYSGRCLLSNYLAGRDANRGECAQSCRWRYALTEEKRPQEFFPVEEDGRGTYILNSKDLSLLSYLPEIISAGVDSLKIEGRMKSLHYLAGTVRTYRAAIDAYLAAPQDFALKEEWLRELDLVSHRPYTAGFFPGEAKEPMQVYGSSSYLRKAEFVGVVRAYDAQTKLATVEQRGVLRVGDKIEIMQPTQGDFAQRIDVMYDDGGNSIERAPHAQQSLKIPLDRPAEPYAILRREV